MVREATDTHRCFCVIIHNADEPGEAVEDPCPVDGLGPDQPFCQACQETHQSGLTLSEGDQLKSMRLPDRS